MWNSHEDLSSDYRLCNRYIDYSTYRTTQEYTDLLKLILASIHYKNTHKIH